MTERLPNKQQMTGEEVGRRKSEKGVEEAQRRRNVGGVVKQNVFKVIFYVNRVK